jgi:hypothetical protein
MIRKMKIDIVLKSTVVTFLLGIALMAMSPHVALAVSPTPNATMADVNSSQGYPTGNGAGIIEALGMIGPCSYNPYTESDVEATAIAWIKAGHNTIVEVTPQTYCDSSYLHYESALEAVYFAIQSGVSNTAFNRYFGGFMIDEEPYSNFWYLGSTSGNLSTASTQLGNLNLYAYQYVDGTSLGPYSELANAGGWWTQSEYNNVALVGGLSTPAPQIYNTTMVGYQNSLVSTYGNPTLVTCNPTDLACATAEADVNGSSFEYTTWGSLKL